MSQGIGERTGTEPAEPVARTSSVCRQNGSGKMPALQMWEL
jgi:hypothetical protein